MCVCVFPAHTICMCIYVNICTCVYISIHIHVHICIYTYISSTNGRDISTNTDDWDYFFKLYSLSQNSATVDHSKLSRQVDLTDSKGTFRNPGRHLYCTVLPIGK